MISSTPEIIDEFRRGRMVVIVDDEDRENEGDLIIAAEFATPEAINFMITHARGLVCLPLSEALCRKLGLSPMVKDNRSVHHTNFTTSIEAATGVTTGISAYDRARTIAVAIADDAKPEDLVGPGHVFPLTAMPGGVLARAGHTEAGCDLSLLAGLKPAAVLCEIVKNDGTMARLPDLIPFAERHGLKIGTVSDLIEYRSKTETLVEKLGDREIDTPYGPATLATFREKTGGLLHAALVFGDVSPEVETKVRVHTPVTFLDALFAKDPFGRRHTIDSAIRKMAGDPGVLLFLRQNEPEDETIARFFETPNKPTPAKEGRWDPKIYGIGAQILKALGAGRIQLMGSPLKMPSVSGFGLEIVGYDPPSHIAS